MTTGVGSRDGSSVVGGEAAVLVGAKHVRWRSSINASRSAIDGAVVHRPQTEQYTLNCLSSVVIATRSLPPPIVISCR